MKNYIKPILIGLSATLLISGCGSSSDNSSTEKGRLQVKFISTDSLIESSTRNILSRSVSLRDISEDNTSHWYDGVKVKESDFAQTAGKPDVFKFKFTNIDLNPVNDSDGVLNIFNDSDGKEIAITSTKVDISNLFENTLGYDIFCFNNKEEEIDCKNENGEENEDISYVEYEVKTGTYNQIRTSLKAKAQIKGCITQSYSSDTNTSGTHTYCTQTNHSVFNNYGQNLDFENNISEITDVDLWGTANPERDDFLADYGIPNNITISTNEKVTLTLLIDTNRAMRFYNQANGINDGEAPSGISDKSYFFSSKIDHDMFIFVGEPGKIEGYSYYARECNMDGGRISDIPNDRMCDNNNSNFDSMINGWITLVYDKDNNPLMVNIKSDYHHGNIKGNNLKGSGAETYHDTTMFKKNNNDTINISTIYGDENPTSLTIENFQNISAGSGFETTFISNNDGMNFSGWGNIYIKREF